VLAAGTGAFVLVCSQLLNHPPAAQHEGAMLGAWLALGGAAVMQAGGIATIAFVSLRVTFDRRRGAAPVAPPPGSPAPPPGADPGETRETRELP
jgi:hypothetical protein